MAALCFWMKWATFLSPRERVGGTATLRADFRIIAATNKNLKKAVQEGVFREDLYYRLNVVPLVLPPLRERREDIPLLARSFIENFAQAHNRKVAAMAPAAVEILMRYSWPGNVRELENVMERAVVLCRGTHIELPQLLFLMQEPEHKVLNLALQQRLQETDLTRLYAQLVLHEQHGNKKEACRVLGINYRTLQSRLGVEPHSEILTPGTRYHVSH
jgi:transcriptional regulator with PAS, ATPase and Fis domain